MEKDIIKSVVKSLDGSDQELYPFLSYILQDVWEFGSSSAVICNLIGNNLITDKTKPNKIIDLGCGKGAVAIGIAQQFEINVLGVDAYPDFINEANQRAVELGLTELCQFITGDIRDINHQSDFDVVILGSIGPVFGNIDETLKQVKTFLKPQGYLILDDGYLRDDTDWVSQIYLQKTIIYNHIKNNDFRVIDEYHYEQQEMEETDEDIFHFIETRIAELKEKYPDKKEMLNRYLIAQAVENEILEKQIECVTWLMQLE